MLCNFWELQRRNVIPTPSANVLPAGRRAPLRTGAASAGAAEMCRRDRDKAEHHARALKAKRHKQDGFDQPHHAFEAVHVERFLDQQAAFDADAAEMCIRDRSYLGLLGMGAVSAACGLLPPVFAGWMAFAALCICLGAAGNVHAIPLTAYIQETVEAEKMGRAFSVLTLISSVTMPVGLLLSSPIAEQVGVHTWFLLSGSAIVLMTGAVILWQRMRCRKGGEALDPEI